jgi:hypothetical protein
MQETKLNGVTIAVGLQRVRMRITGIFPYRILRSEIRNHQSVEVEMKSFRYLQLWLLLFESIVSLSPCSAQTAAVDEYNIPTEIDKCIKNSRGLSISGEINPFYVSGDFDGDGRLDFAVQVVRSDTKGILVCLSSRRIPLLVGAGSALVWSSNQKWRFNAWSVVPKDSKNVSWPANAKGDAILLDVKEAANGLLYWDGTALRWKQLSD